ncbi:GntR family transcriptional regulator [Desulfotignum balticum]|uniref:GntR family transcriptional regulator n=1 Tax=Desulfotignum balticum TaxID=115781 RepID=UPI00040E56AC|nr:GntR family transcriptional regulator [Desulfotignum balticum]
MKFFPLEKESSVPLYVQMADIIKKNIDEGHLLPNNPLPSESQLMKVYNTSRITIRNALLRLEYSGDIFKVHGRGSFVSVKKITDLISPSTSWRSLMEDQGYDVSYELIEFGEVWPNDGVKRELQIYGDEKVKKIKRLKKIHQDTIGLDLFFMPISICKFFKENYLKKHSIFDFLNSSQDTRITRIESQIRSAAIEDGDAETMNVDYSNTVLIRGFVAFNSKEEPVLSGKVMYLSQYAVVNVKMDINQENSTCSIVDVPGIKFNEMLKFNGEKDSKIRN